MGQGPTEAPGRSRLRKPQREVLSGKRSRRAGRLVPGSRAPAPQQCSAAQRGCRPPPRESGGQGTAGTRGPAGLHAAAHARARSVRDAPRSLPAAAPAGSPDPSQHSPGRLRGLGTRPHTDRPPTPDTEQAPRPPRLCTEQKGRRFDPVRAQAPGRGSAPAGRRPQAASRPSPFPLPPLPPAVQPYRGASRAFTGLAFKATAT